MPHTHNTYRQRLMSHARCVWMCFTYNLSVHQFFVAPGSSTTHPLWLLLLFRGINISYWRTLWWNGRASSSHSPTAAGSDEMSACASSTYDDDDDSVDDDDVDGTQKPHKQNAKQIKLVIYLIFMMFIRLMGPLFVPLVKCNMTAHSDCVFVCVATMRRWENRSNN